MLSKFVAMMVLAVAVTGAAWAQVDVNRADQATLESIKGVGPAMSKAMLTERTKGGNFKDWSDLEKRVKGVGPASAQRLSQGGLTVNGKPRPDAKMEPVAHQLKSAPAK
jgi:competence protein ComEA